MNAREDIFLRTRFSFAGARMVLGVSDSVTGLVRSR